MEERVDSHGGLRPWWRRRPVVGIAGVFLAVALIATLAPGARTALLESVSYLAPLALFVGVQSAIDWTPDE